MDRPCGSIFMEPGPREDLALLLINFHSKVYSESFVSPAATNQGPPLTHRKAKSGGKVGHYLLIQISP